MNIREKSIPDDIRIKPCHIHGGAHHVEREVGGKRLWICKICLTLDVKAAELVRYRAERRSAIEDHQHRQDSFDIDL